MTAKKPQDRKPPAPKVKQVPGGREVTLRGVTVTVPDDALDDFEFMDDLRRLTLEKNAALLTAPLRRLVGDQWKQVMDALRNPDTGRVSVMDGTNFMQELLEAIAPES